ncbi:MAG: hypothetical protein Q4G45_01810 [Actinomycetia bacterium]|nr:hypothetical protein [Actinomycetes bacterium]
MVGAPVRDAAPTGSAPAGATGVTDAGDPAGVETGAAGAPGSADHEGVPAGLVGSPTGAGTERLGTGRPAAVAGELGLNADRRGRATGQASGDGAEPLDRRGSGLPSGWFG